MAEEAEQAFGASITSDLGTQDMGSVSGCRVEDSKDLRRRTVGRMLPGNKVRLLDKDTGEQVPDGEPGVLYFRGPHAPAGYYRDEELTNTVSIRMAGPPPATSSSSTRVVCGSWAAPKT